MLRFRVFVWILSLLLFGTWLFSQEMDPPDLLGAIRNIEATLHQLQKDVKELHGSVKELARSGNRKKNAPTPAAAPAQPEAPGSAPAWQLARDAYERGRRAEDLKSFPGAIEAYTQAIELDAKNDSAFLHRAYCYYDSGDFAKAIADLKRAIELQPNDSRAYEKRAAALEATGQNAAAVPDANEAIQRDPKNPGHYLLRASLNQQLGNAQQVLDDYAKAIELAPGSDTAYLARAAFLRSQGQVQKSLEDCYKAIQLNPADAAAYLCRAQFYLTTGAAQPALEDINRAMLIGHNPAETAPLLSSAQHMLQAEVVSAPIVTVASIEPAPAIMRTVPVAKPEAPELPPQQPIRRAEAGKEPPPVAHDISRDATSLYRAGRAYSQQERFEDALAAFNEALRLDPKNAQVRNARGYAYLRLHEYREALADFNEALRLNPNYANAQRNREVAMEAAGVAAGSR